ncbi:MAG: phosphoribosyl-ATP diphosphatase [Anaerolineae bacterium]|nr:phosphoribosyl-ATP diphosphatase [Anaerolineae bacterium]MDW8173246.1 phosphoribosyl-ATP diphosphatase [Anaerolineae bacterium]
MNNMLETLQEIIRQRRANPQEGSYTARLMARGRSKIAQKVGEEAVEVVVAAMGQGREEQISELSDLLYHTLVLMVELGISLDDLYVELARRHQERQGS